MECTKNVHKTHKVVTHRVVQGMKNKKVNKQTTIIEYLKEFCRLAACNVVAQSNLKPKQ